MKVYITKTFEEFLEKSFSNYFINYKDLSNKLKITFKNNLYLKRPIMKFKIRIKGVSFRLVGIVKGDIILPILIYLKKDKQKGENITWNKELEILINHYAVKLESDIKNNYYDVY